MIVIKFIVPGKPIGKKSSVIIINSKTKKIGMKVNPKSQAYIDAIKTIAKTKAPREPIKAPMVLYAIAYFKKPKKPQFGKYAISKTDADNILKSICDGIKKIIVYDDNYLTDKFICKRYSGNPRTEIMIKTLT